MNHESRNHDVQNHDAPDQQEMNRRETLKRLMAGAAAPWIVAPQMRAIADETLVPELPRGPYPMISGTMRVLEPPQAMWCEYLSNPLGVDVARPRFSWTMEATNILMFPDNNNAFGSPRPLGRRQSAYQVLVATDSEQPESEEDGGNTKNADSWDMWDSGIVKSDRMSQIEYDGKPLESNRRYCWTVRQWDEDGRPCEEQHATAYFSTGLLKPEDWTAQWISFRDTTPLYTRTDELFLPPPREYRRAFRVKKPIRRATLFASALGNCDLYINGELIHDSVLLPGWADYEKRNYYRTFEVTSFLNDTDDDVTEGGNVIGAIVADGWYAGYVGYGLLCGYGPERSGRSFYGKTPALLMQLVIEYDDGTTETIGTDSSWKVSADGPVREADIIMGESYDAQMERSDWCTFDYDDSAWESAIPAEENEPVRATFYDNRGSREVMVGFRKPERMQSYMAPEISAPTRDEQRRSWGSQREFLHNIPSLNSYEYQPGVWIYDLGQEIAGVAEIAFQGEPGTRVQIRYGEMVHPDGRLMTENLRRARATDYYTLRGDGDGEVWRPRFTYHGFRYVEISGPVEKPIAISVVGIPLNNRTPLTSTFECSNPMVNRLFRNIVWTQLANFIEVPTDCPQRDERLGWMGDAQAYIRTASYNADVAAFFTKWLDDLEECQLENGAYPDYAPYPMSHGNPGLSWGTAWTDAGIICPWTMLKVYGDTRLVREHYASMRRFMDFREKSSPDRKGVSLGNTWGDWLSLNETTPIEYVDICYFANSARKMAEMAASIGETADAAKYERLYREICTVHNAEYLNTDGTLKVDTQTAYVLALDFDMIPADRAAASAQRLVDKIRGMDTRMTTGFLGTKAILPVLSKTGHHDVAMELFLSTKLPSWGFEVENGATTVWERWDSYSKSEGGAKHIGMNSFAHYAFGAVCEWMFRDLAGIDLASNGYRALRLAPRPYGQVASLDWLKAEYMSPVGFVRSVWNVSMDGDGGRKFSWKVTLPAGVSARLVVPTSTPDSIRFTAEPVPEDGIHPAPPQQVTPTEFAVIGGSWNIEAKE